MKSGMSRRRALLLPWLCAIRVPNLQAQTAYELEVPGGLIETVFVNGGFSDAEVVFGWVNRAVKAIAPFYGQFPVPRLRLFVESARDRRSVFGGVTFGGSPPFINVSVSEQSTAKDLADDWILNTAS